MIRVLVWNEYKHEQTNEAIAAIYPKGIHGVIAEFLGKEEDITVKTATMYDENYGITKEVLAETDVLVWWSHGAALKMPDEVGVLIQKAVFEGMGAIFLHSAHLSKPFTRLMGTPCCLTWRCSEDSELLWVVDPVHPITQGIDRFVKLDAEETYGEPFSIPEPDKVLFIANFSGGEVFRAGCLYQRGNGKVFYFQPGHESYPTYYVPEIQRIITNAVRYVAPIRREKITCPETNLIGSGEPYIKSLW